MAEWGHFQSLIQISIALNAAYAALATYLGTHLSNERGLLRDMIDCLEKTVASNTNSAKAKFGLQLLYGKSIAIEHRHERAINAILRPVCILAAVVGSLFLVWSSFYFESAIPAFFQLVSCIMILPFLVGAIYSVTESMIAYFAVSRQRRQYETGCLGT